MMLRLLSAVFAVLVVSAASAEDVPVQFISSDAWFRAGPSISDERITGLPRGTAVLEIAEPETLFQGRSGRWIRVFVLEGRAAGREGWVWGEFVDCCKDYGWLD